MGVRRYDDVTDAPPSDAIYVGRFSGPKGVPTLLEAWKIVTQANPGAVLTLVGRNQDGYDVAAEVQALGLDRNTRILTGLSDAQVFAHVRRAKIFVTASREEGYGLSVLEALSAGIPCVTFDLEAFRLVFPQGRAVAPQMTASSLASTVQKLLVDTQLRQTLSEAGRQSVAERNWDSVADLVMKRAMRPTR
jgi:glycosyltransferase involved in cell wall biosynthesis